MDEGRDLIDVDVAVEDDRPASELDDLLDREELRRRYYGLMQELRVLLPGVQILVAFLLTTPFASRFERLDDTGRVLYGIALCTGITSVVAFATPTVIHRVGHRRVRALRLVWGVRLFRVGLAAFAAALVAALTLVTRVVFSDAAGWVAAGLAAVVVVAAWLVLPLSLGRHAARWGDRGSDR